VVSAKQSAEKLRSSVWHECYGEDICQMGSIECHTRTALTTSNALLSECCPMSLYGCQVASAPGAHHYCWWPGGWCSAVQPRLPCSTHG
jgi:hypothetical protein